MTTKKRNVPIGMVMLVALLINFSAHAQSVKLKKIKDRDFVPKMVETHIGVQPRLGDRLGMFVDADGDGDLELVSVGTNDAGAVFRVLQVESNQESVRTILPVGRAAGLAIINFDADDDLEFIVVQGHRQQNFADYRLASPAELELPVRESLAGEVIVRRSRNSDGRQGEYVSYDLKKQSDGRDTTTKIRTGGPLPSLRFASADIMTDIRAISVLDGNGDTVLQHDVDTSNGGVHLRAMVAHSSGYDVTLVTTSVAKGGGADAEIPSVIAGISVRTGEVLWSHRLPGNKTPATMAYSTLFDGERELSAIMTRKELLIIDAVSGAKILETSLPFSEITLGELHWSVFSGMSDDTIVTVDTRIPGIQFAALAGGRLFNTRNGKGFLFHNSLAGLSMLSLETGDVLWTLPISDQRPVSVLFDDDADQFHMVYERSVQAFNANGEPVSDSKLSGKMKQFNRTIYRDLEGDGTRELIYLSGNRVISWSVANGSQNWKAKLGGILGAANPNDIHDALYDINGDGWLDIPGIRGSGAGRWLSGKDGKELDTIGRGYAIPIIDDWDGDDAPEMFWSGTWYEVVRKK